MKGELLAYWEQGWEGRIEFAFQSDDSPHPIFLQNGDRLTILNHDGTTLWAGVIQFVPRRCRDNHKLATGIWSYEKQKGVSYAEWMDWFWRQPPLKAALEIETDVNKVQDDHASVKIHPPILTLFHLGAAFLMNWLIPLPLTAHQALKTFGLALGFIGFLLGAAAAVEFGRAHTTLNPHGSVSKLVIAGVYRFSRNPIYLGFVLITIGIPLALDNFWGILFAPILLLFFNALVIRHEEAYLEKKFGDEYAGYRSRVRRWL